MDRHREILPRLVAFHDGALDSLQAREIEDHLALCPHCRRKLDDWRNLDRALLALPEAEGAADFVVLRALGDIRAMSIEAKRGQTRPGAARIPNWAYWTLGLAAVFALALGITLFW